MKEENNFIGGIKKETYELLFNDENLAKPIRDNKLNDAILDEIAVFTTFDENELNGKIKKKIYEMFFHIDFSKISYNKEDKKYHYNCGEDKTIIFERFSDSIEDGKYKKELLSSKRYKKCHEKAMILASNFENPVSILNGICQRHGKRHLHSIIELLTKKGDIYVVDYTLNLFMPKETYIELMQFEELESIKDIEYIKDRKDGTIQLITDMDSKIKPYLMFRKELKKDLEKNKSMMKEVNDEKLNKRIEEIKEIREEFERE